MKKPFNQTTRRAKCPVCQKVFPATLEHFSYCFSCNRWVCREDIRPCDVCRVTDVCLDCARKIREKYLFPSIYHRCEKCADFCNRWFKSPN